MNLRLAKFHLWSGDYYPALSGFPGIITQLNNPSYAETTTTKMMMMMIPITLTIIFITIVIVLRGGGVGGWGGGILLLIYAPLPFAVLSFTITYSTTSGLPTTFTPDFMIQDCQQTFPHYRPAMRSSRTSGSRSTKCVIKLNCFFLCNQAMISSKTPYTD